MDGERAPAARGDQPVAGRPALMPLVSLLLLVPCRQDADAASAELSPAVHKAYEARMAGQTERAREILLSALEDDPGDAALYFELARASLYLLDLDRAQKAIEEAVQLSPSNARYHCWLGTISTYSAVSKNMKAETRAQMPNLMRKALEGFRQAVELDPDHHDARFRLINCYVKNPTEAGGDRVTAEEQTRLLE